MFRLLQAFAAISVLGFCGAVTAETSAVTHGGDRFIAGEQLNEVLETGGDGFLAARTIQASGTAGGDLHVTGFDLTVNTDTAQDLYAVGATVVVRGSVGEDLTAAGFSVRTDDTSVIQGNARMFGNSVIVESPVKGALLVTARDVILNAEIDGDVRVLAQSISFGPDAVVNGTLTYAMGDPTTVPERVAPESRVVFEPVSRMDVWEDLDEWDDFGRDMPFLPTFASMMFGFIISLLFFLVLGALMLGFMPKRLAKMRRSIAAAPGQTVLLGVIGLSMLFGMVPITAMTIVAIPFVPIVLLAIVVIWTLGYALGAYGVAMRLWTGFGGADDPSNVARLVIFAAAIVAVALLNFIPFVGWVANFTLVLLGVGAMTRAVFNRLIGNPGATFDIDMKPIED